MSNPDNAALKPVGESEDGLLPRSLETIAAEFANYGDKIKKTAAQIAQMQRDLEILWDDFETYMAIQTSARRELASRLAKIAEAEQGSEYAHAAAAMSAPVDAIPY